MRPANHYLTAVCLLATCAVLIFFKSGKNESIDPKPMTKGVSETGKQGPITHFREKPAPANPALPQATALHSKVPGASHSFQVPSAEFAQPQIPAIDPQPSSTAQAVQLAENVRLPAALMIPPSDMRNNPDHPIAAARRNIADTFYQEIAKKPAPASSRKSFIRNVPKEAIISETATSSEVATTSDVPTTPEEMVTAGQEDEPLLINPTPEVDDARHHADETYRALFGDDAYNRQTMNSAVEVNLPPDSGIDPH